MTTYQNKKLESGQFTFLEIVIIGCSAREATSLPFFMSHLEFQE